MKPTVEELAKVGKRLPRNPGTCPECGGPAEIQRNGDWRCIAYDRNGLVTIAVCEAEGTTVGGDLVVTRGSTGVWRYLITPEEVAREGADPESSVPSSTGNTD